MRIKLFVFMMILTLAACGGKNDAPVDPAAENGTTLSLPADDQGLGDAVLDIQFDPIADFGMKSGERIPIVEFKKLGKYFVYISGKLNGRASTVISITRLDDFRRWAGIAFKDPHNFVIITRDSKQLNFTDARIFIGSDSYDTFTIVTSGDNYTTKTIEVNKADISTLKLLRLEEE